MLKRDFYLNRLIHHMWNGEVKVITGFTVAANRPCCFICFTTIFSPEAFLRITS